MPAARRRPPVGGISGRRSFLAALVGASNLLLASCGEDEDKYKPGGGYQFPGGKQDEKGQYTQGNPI
ncbi:MAG: hypothetical protein F4Y02_15305 [Chloroflexi bacterium]|nr:hypothetical protein [Chloroflexota bacterium]